MGLWCRLIRSRRSREWRENRDQLEQNTQDLEAQLEEWEKTREEASTKKEEAETSVEQAQEFLEAQEQEVQEKIEEDRAREAELALDHVGKMLQDATGEQPSDLAAGEKGKKVDETDDGGTSRRSARWRDKSRRANRRAGGRRRRIGNRRKSRSAG